MRVASRGCRFASDPLFRFSDGNLRREISGSGTVVVLTSSVGGTAGRRDGFVIGAAFTDPRSNSAFLLPPCGPFVVVSTRRRENGRLRLPGCTPAGQVSADCFNAGGSVSSPTRRVCCVKGRGVPCTVGVPGVGRFSCGGRRRKAHVSVLCPRFAQ